MDQRDGPRIPTLDGLRGLAVLAVMLFHQTVMVPATGFDRGFARVVGSFGSGVDLFFVLSGFLITGILYDSRASAGYYRNFYARRSLRIVPLYYAVLFVALVVLPCFPHPRLEKWGHVHGLGQAWYWLFLSNWSIALGGHGFRHGMIDLSWTLSIEEQFYLTWPLVVRSFSRRRLMAICVGLMAVSFGTRWALLSAGAPEGWALLMTPARMDALAVGAWIALLARGEGNLARLVPAARWVALGAGCLTAAALPPASPLGPGTALGTVLEPSAFALLFGALLILTIEARSDGPLARVFGARSLRTFGVFSYALYLFHNPIQALIREKVFGPSQFPTWFGSPLPGQLLFYVLATLPALGGAWLSWHLFEGPILRLKRFFPSRRAEATRPGGSPSLGSPAREHPGLEEVGVSGPREHIE